jgi:ribosomal protein S12 methylthiotransferase
MEKASGAPATGNRPRVGFVSLGCPKNLVDSEVMMGLLDRAGALMTPDAETADILVVNTCSFIDKAKQESVDAILEMARLKTAGSARKLIVAGCLVERYRDEIQKNIPEVDAVVGTGELEQILAAAGLAALVKEPGPASPFNILSGNGQADVRPGRESSCGDSQGCDQNAGLSCRKAIGVRSRGGSRAPSWDGAGRASAAVSLRPHDTAAANDERLRQPTSRLPRVAIILAPSA